MASCERGTDITRPILPAGSITSIDSDAASTNSVESPRNAIRLPERGPYAFAVLLVESATMLTVFNVESTSSTRRLVASLMSNRPPGSARTLFTTPSESVVVACTAPSGRMGGRVCAPSAGTSASAVSVNRNMRYRIMNAVP